MIGLKQPKTKGRPRVLMIDNYDSFTFNLVHYLEQLNVEVIVKRNDEITCDQVSQLNPSHIVISPGPCTPNEAGISLELISRFKKQIPILGVCLGHQVIGQAFGANIVTANKIMHGKTSIIVNNGHGLFKKLPKKFTATRYHSLVIDLKNFSEELEITAWTEDKKSGLKTIMGIKHKRYNVQGVQFHPESILSECGLALLSGFIL